MSAAGIDKMCEMTAAAEKMVKDKVAKPVKKAIERVKNTFYFSVDIDYHYNVTLKQSQTAAQARLMLCYLYGERRLCFR